MKRLANYIESHFGVGCSLEPATDTDLLQMPLAFLEMYVFYRGTLGLRSVIWAQVLHPEQSKPRMFEKQKTILQSSFQQPVIFAFEDLDPYLRARLIADRIAFVHPPRQLFIPELLLELNDGKRLTPEPAQVTALSAPAQAGLISHLLTKRLDKMPLHEVADHLGYSVMTMSRIARELKAVGLASIDGRREKQLNFHAEGATLWQLAQPFLQSPVREIWFCDQVADQSCFQIAGESALAAQTMLAEPAELCFAIGKDQFLELKTQKLLPPLHPRLGNIKLEVWRYAPRAIFGGQLVDPLSLTLSLRKDADERLEMEANNLIEQVQWSQD